MTHRRALTTCALLFVVALLALMALLRLTVLGLRPAGATSPLSAVEAQIVSADHEIVVVFDARGREIGRYEGSASSTTVYPDNRWRGGVLTHNHVYPNLRDLSLLDLRTAEHTGLSEIRAVSGSPFTVCHATRQGRTWQHFDFDRLDAAYSTVIDGYDYDTMHVRALAWYGQLSAALHFGYGCEAVG